MTPSRSRARRTRAVLLSAALWLVTAVGPPPDAGASLPLVDCGGDLHRTVASVGEEPETLVIDGPCRIRSDIRFPASMKVKFLEGGHLLYGHHSVVFEGPLEAGGGRIFAGEGGLEIRANPQVRLEWFGVSPDATAEANSRRVAQALKAPPPGNGCRVTLERPGVYSLAAPFEVTRGNLVLEFGPDVIFRMARKSDGLYVHGNSATDRIADVTVRNFVLDGAGRSICGILAMYCDRLVLDGCRTWDNGSDGIFVGGIGVDTSWDGRVLNCEVSNSGAFGIIAVGTHRLEVAGCRVTECRRVRHCASAIQMKNSVDFDLHDNIVVGGEHGINIRCSSNGSDTTGVCRNNETRNALKVGIYVHHDTLDGKSGELRDILLTGNRISDPGWLLISVSASEEHRIANLEVRDNLGARAGTNGAYFGNIRNMKWANNRLLSVAGRGVVLFDVQDSVFSDGFVQRSDGQAYPVLRIRKSVRNGFRNLTLVQPNPSAPCVVEESGSDANLFQSVQTVGCGPEKRMVLQGAESRELEAAHP